MATTISLTKGTAMDKLPKPIGNTPSPENTLLPAAIEVVFVDDDFKPDLEYYRQLYAKAGYSEQAIQSLLKGLSKSSLYGSQTP